MKRPVRRLAGLRIALYLPLTAAACLLPLWWGEQDSRWVLWTSGIGEVRFELFGLMASMALLVVAAVEIRAGGLHRGPLRDALPILIPLAVGLHFATWMSEYRERRWDYECYETAAVRVLQGRDPYGAEPPHLHGSPRPYLYPPGMAQAMAEAYRLVARAPELTGWRARVSAGRAQSAGEAILDALYYLYRCIQFLLVLAAYALLVACTRALGVARIPAHALVAALLVLDNPLFRTLRSNQTNLWLLDLGLLALLARGAWSVVGGAGLAVAVHLKLYPVLLLGVLAGSRRWLALASCATALVLVLALQTDVFRDWTAWEQYLAFTREFSWERELRFRNNSVQSLIYNSLSLLGAGRGEGVAALSRIAARGLGLAAAVWVLRRFRARETARRREESRLSAGGAGAPARDALAAAVLLGHGADAFALGLLATPSAWEHHYVLALPLVLWTVVVSGRDRPWLVGTAVLLTLALPTFDVFPLSYHRLAGLLLLLGLSPPRLLPPLRAVAQGREDSRA